MHKVKSKTRALKLCLIILQFELSRNLTPNHLHLGNKAELVFDLQEDGVKGQLVGLLIESGKSRSGFSQQAGVARSLFLQDNGYLTEEQMQERL